MGSCKEVITPGVKEVSSSSEPAWFARQVEKEDEDPEEWEKDQWAGRALPGPIWQFVADVVGQQFEIKTGSAKECFGRAWGPYSSFKEVYIEAK